MAPTCIVIFSIAVQRYDFFSYPPNKINKIFKKNIFYKKISFSFVDIKIINTFAAQSEKQLMIVSECSAVGSALRSGRRGRAFESPHSDSKKV